MSYLAYLFIVTGLLWFEQHRYEGHEYAVSDVGRHCKHATCKTYCRRDSAELATISTEAERDVLYEWFREQTST